METRAATVRYENIKVGDTIEFICGKQKFRKVARKVKIHKNIEALVKAYGFKAINPNVNSTKELRELYYTFPDYHDKD